MYEAHPQVLRHAVESPLATRPLPHWEHVSEPRLLEMEPAGHFAQAVDKVAAPAARA